MAEVDESEVLDGVALDDLYGWIDAVPLTRPKKNIARDFSDGVMVSEIIHHYLPRAVDIHNYVAASSSGQKRINWNTLNRKVFAKMNIKLNENTLNQIVEAKPGAIEQVLWDLRRKILEHASTNSHGETDNIVAVARSKSGFTYANLPKGTPSSHFGYSKAVVPVTQSVGKIQHRDRESHHGPSIVVHPPVGKTTTPRIESEKAGPMQPKNGLSSLPPLPKPLPNSRARKADSYLGSVPEHSESTDQSPGDSSSNSDAKTGGPPSQIIYRGHKMVRIECLELKEKETRELEIGKKSLSLKIDRLEKLIEIKDQRIVDLAQQVHNLRSMYERVTQTPVDGNFAT